MDSMTDYLGWFLILGRERRNRYVSLNIEYATSFTSGFRLQGGAGFAKGLARASVNLAVQPAAGMFGLLSHPVKGIGKSVANSFRPELGETVLRQPRAALGTEEARDLDSRTKENMISQFDTLAATVKDRRKVIKKEAELWLHELALQANRSQEVAAVQRETM